MNEYVKVKDNDDLVRDKENSAILNVDADALSKYKMRREQERKRNDTLKKDVSEIKSLLLQMIDKEGNK
jgi:DTW domain-containing protein YfiP